MTSKVKIPKRRLTIRVRNYEADLSDVRLPLADILDPVGVADRTVTCAARGRHFQLAYDRLVFALSSRLVRLDAHLAGLAHTRPSPGRNAVLVIGAGLTGIEVAMEMPGPLRAAGPTRKRSLASSLRTGPRGSSRIWVKAHDRSLQRR